MYFLCDFLNFIRGKIPTWEKLDFFFVICCSICPQNTSLILSNETMEGNSMRLNPYIRYYSTVYIASMGAALLLKTMRGLVFVKVSFPHHLSVTCFIHLITGELEEYDKFVR